MRKLFASISYLSVYFFLSYSYINFDLRSDAESFNFSVLFFKSGDGV